MKTVFELETCSLHQNGVEFCNYININVIRVIGWKKEVEWQQTSVLICVICYIVLFWVDFDETTKKYYKPIYNFKSQVSCHC